MKLAIVCVECGRVEHVPVEGDARSIRLDPKQLLVERGWLLSLVDPHTEVLAPLCRTCVPKVYPTEMIEAAHKLILDT